MSLRPRAATRRDRNVAVLAAVLLAIGGTAGLLVGPGAEAGRAAPGSTGNERPAYPAEASATRYTGPAFDTCAAPSAATMRAWTASPFSAVGVYISGTNRACAQKNLTPRWVRKVSAMGWKLLPISMGLQAPCRDNLVKKPMTAATAGPQGTADAAAAVAAARRLGILPGSALYADIESYDPTRARCVRAVATYVSAFVREAHRAGYLAGMYGNLGSGVLHASQRYDSTKHARPDAAWLARWDRRTNLTGWAGISDTHWAEGARVKQYRGDHVEKHGGVRLNIDSDIVDAPVATVALPYRVSSAGALKARQGPSLTAPVLDTLAPGTKVSVVCQVIRPADSTRWNKLTDGTYVADTFVADGAAKKVGPCSYPAQVLPTVGTMTRSGAAGTAAAAGALPLGGLAWVSCDAGGPWLRLLDGRHVAAADLASVPAALPAC